MVFQRVVGGGPAMAGKVCCQLITCSISMHTIVLFSNVV
jgi:hypothetical protein